MINISKRILIITEDEKSSKSYFESFKKDEKLRRKLASLEIKVVHPKYHNPIGLVTKAKELKLKAKRERNPFDAVWIALDRDEHPNIDKAMVTAKDNNIQLALSVICFEYRILLHFERTSKPFARCDELISYIKSKYIPNYDKKYNYYPLLKDKIQLAVENAKWLQNQANNDLENGLKIHELSAFTNVHQLVIEILNT